MKRLILVFVSLLSFAANAYAIELTLNECVALALQNNGRLKAFDMGVSASREDVNVARTGFFPALKLRSNYTVLDKSDVISFKQNTFGTGIPPSDIDLSANNREMYGLSLSLEQSLFTGGQLTHSLAKSKMHNEEAHHNFERQKKLLIFEVKRAFHESLKEQLHTEILKKAAGFKKERLRALQERQTEGYAQQEDILVAETDLSATDLDLYKVKNRADFALSRLKRLIYTPQDDSELRLKGEPVKGLLNVTLQEITEVALKNRDDLKMSSARLRAAGEDIGIAASDFYPQASLQGRYTVQKETTIARPEIWMFIAQLDWSLFEWNKTRSEVRKAKAINQRLKYEHEELIKAVALEAEDAWRTVRENEKEVEFKEKRLKTFEYRYERTMDRYAEGAVKLADLLEMEAELIRSYNEYLIAINNLDVSVANLETNASALQEGWFSIVDIYRPNLESLSKRVQGLINEKKAKQDGN